MRPTSRRKCVNFLTGGEQKPYIPLQTSEGECAGFLKDAAVDTEYEGTKYRIVPRSAILAVVCTEIVGESGQALDTGVRCW